MPASSTTRRRARATASRYSAKHLRLGVAEAENGLVDVAHGVEIAGPPQQSEQLGLLAVGVLKLVHQDVVELRLNARAGFGVFLKQPHRELFQIREIERAGLRACARDTNGRSGAAYRIAIPSGGRNAR